MNDATPSTVHAKGVRRILSSAKVYDLFQRMSGLNRSYDTLVGEYFGDTTGRDVLDIGCGTAAISQWMPGARYQGFDPNADYISTAEESLPVSVSVWQASIEEPGLDSTQRFDLILGVGVLHHVDDEVADRFFSLASHHLREGGRAVTMDPCKHENQSFLARTMVSRDRGEWVRNSDEYVTLARGHFENVSVGVRDDLLRFPYSHAIVTSSDVSESSSSSPQSKRAK